MFCHRNHEVRLLLLATAAVCLLLAACADPEVLTPPAEWQERAEAPFAVPTVPPPPPPPELPVPDPRNAVYNRDRARAADLANARIRVSNHRVVRELTKEERDGFAALLDDVTLYTDMPGVNACVCEDIEITVIRGGRRFRSVFGTDCAQMYGWDEGALTVTFNDEGAGRVATFLDWCLSRPAKPSRQARGEAP